MYRVRSEVYGRICDFLSHLDDKDDRGVGKGKGEEKKRGTIISQVFMVVAILLVAISFLSFAPLIPIIYLYGFPSPSIFRSLSTSPELVLDVPVFL